MAQDYQNIEIIVVNDVSTDGTASVARQVLENCPRPYKIIGHEKNRGVSAARNTGMESAAGEYVTFIDSDDFVDAGYISEMHKTISGAGSDVAVCGYKTLRADNGMEESHPLNIHKAGDTAPVFSQRVMRGDIGIYFGAALYRTDLLTRNGISFIEGCTCGEDAEFFIKAISVSAKISFSIGCHYVYRIHGKMGSRTGHVSPEQNVKRYTDLIQGRIRAGHYVIGHSKIPALTAVAQYELLPRYYLKMFTMHSWRGDKDAFFADLRSPEIRRIILSGGRAFLKSPDILLKGLWLLVFPNIYYAYRYRHVYYYLV
jgi:glycosyltransferase involved in cell wall biosynthesis